jgi:hypothetical protein
MTGGGEAVDVDDSNWPVLIVLGGFVQILSRNGNGAELTTKTKG